MVMYIASKCYVVQDNTMSIQVVLDLLDGFEHNNLQVYMDRFYVVLIYFSLLLVKGLLPNRKKFPKDMVIKATRHNRDYRSNGSLLVIVWVDKRSIYMTSQSKNIYY